MAIDAVGIRGHGGAAILCELLHWLPHVRPGWLWHVFLLDRSLREFDDPPVSDRVTIEHTRYGDSGPARLTWVNSRLQKRVRQIGADRVLSFANIGARKPVVPQMVLVHQLNAFANDHTAQGAFLNRVRMLFLRRQILTGAKASRTVIVQTEGMKNRMEQVAPDLAGRIHVIPGGYRTFSTDAQTRKQVRDTILSSSRPRLIYISHPGEHKNHLNLLRSLPAMIKVWPSLQLFLTLEGNEFLNRRYTSFVTEIRKTAVALDVENNLTFLGILNHDEIYFALSNCDVMVFPSLVESFGLGLVEAMAAGCPIAVSDLPYARDVAADAAVYFDPKDPHSIARAVVSLLNNPSEAARLRKEGVRLKSHYSYANIAERIAHVLES